MDTLNDYFRLGFHAAAAGFYFDAMELVAVLSVELGSFDKLEGLLADMREAQANAHDHLDAVRYTRRDQSAVPVASVDDYRAFLTEHAFGKVEALAQLERYDVSQRLQAAFYAGFGLGRYRTTLMGVRFYQKLRNAVPETPSLAGTPKTLESLTQEAVRQLAIARKHPDLRAAHPRMDGLLTLSPELRGDAEHLLAIDPRDLELCVQAIDEGVREIVAELGGLR